MEKLDDISIPHYIIKDCTCLKCGANFMYVLQILSGVLSFITCIPLFVYIYKNKIKQNWVTWILWALIDIIISIMTILECGNFWLSFGYALGATSISILLFIKKQGTCKWFEILTIFLVIISVFIWWKLGNKEGIYACIVTIFIASIPQFVEVIEKPFNNKLIIIYIIFSLADLLSLISGRDWSIEERIYPGSQLFVGTIIILTSVFVKKHKKQRILHWS